MLMVLAAGAQKVNLLPDTILLCAGDTAGIEVRHDIGSQHIRWRTPAGAIHDERRIKAYLPGTYYLRALSAAGIATHYDSTYVKVLQRPVPLLRDTFFCAGSKVLLDAGNAGMRYQWSTGEKTRTLSVSSDAQYRVRISNGKCVTHDTVEVRMLGTQNPVAQQEMSFCVNEPVKVIAVKNVPDIQVQWDNGAISHTLAIVKEGIYGVTVSHPLCTPVRDSVRVTIKACECEIMVPNSFTPNEDGRNDYFFPVLACEYTYYNLTITDRWGNEVFVTYSTTGKWDGRYKGNLCPEDIYVFRIESTEKLTGKKSVRKGHISLFR